jgi:hypothetical protein
MREDDEFCGEPMCRSDGEHPERAYRRGYQQGAQAMVAALEGKIDPMTWESLQDYVDGKVARGRYSKRGRKRDVLRDQPPTIERR